MHWCTREYLAFYLTLFLRLKWMEDILSSHPEVLLFYVRLVQTLRHLKFVVSGLRKILYIIFPVIYHYCNYKLLLQN